MIGPLTFSVDGLTIGSCVSDFKPEVDLHGLGISNVALPLSIQGSILKLPKNELDPDVNLQFDGTVTVQAEKYGILAIASYAQLKNGIQSFFVYAQLNATLGGPPYFIVEGLMGGFGFNRNLRIPDFDEVIDFPLLAFGTSNEAATKNNALHVLQILEGEKPGHTGKTRKWIQPQAGDYWLAVGLKFSSCELVHGKLLLVAELGRELQFALLGIALLRLPMGAPDTETYAYLELQLEAVLKPTEGYFSISAALTSNSYVISKDCHVSGAFMFCIWFGSNENAGQFVLTAGGYHPAFKQPAYYPTVPRVGFNWAVCSSVSVKGDAYFAITPSCAMAGGSLEVLFHMGDLRAWFTAHANMLMTWNPFSFMVNINIEIGVSYKLSFLGSHKMISLTAGASMDLWGSPTGGRVKVHVSIVSFTISFGSDSSANPNNQPLEWQDFKMLLPKTEDICKISISKGLYDTLQQPAKEGGTKSVWIVRSGGFSFFTQSGVPASMLTCNGTVDSIHNVTDKNGGISIRPMNKTRVLSTHNLKIFKGSTNSTPVDVTDWTLTPITTSMPETLWGNPLTEGANFTQRPTTPSAAVVADLLTGYTVNVPAPATGSALGPVSLTELMEEYIKINNGNAQNPFSIYQNEIYDFIPVYNEDSLMDVADIATKKTVAQRNSLYQSLNGSYKVANGSMNIMAESAKCYFSNAPLEQV
jgi:hypothetical protein